MHSMQYTSYVFKLIAAFGVVITGTTVGAERPVPKSIQTLLTIHCADCHQGEDAQQGIDLTRSSTQLTNLEHSETLDRIYSAVKWLNGYLFSWYSSNSEFTSVSPLAHLSDVS